MDLDLIERYYDLAPRAAADVEEIGPFTLFVADPATGWSLYARPRPRAAADVTPDDVRRVLARQTELRVPRAVEWVDEVTPALLPAVRAAVPTPDELALCPLLALPEDAVLPSAGGSTRVLAGDDPDLPLVLGAVSASFRDRDEFSATEPGRRAEMIAEGLLVVVAAYDDSGAVVGGGSAAPRGDVAELMGIAIVPSARRRGLGAATTAALAAACRDRGVRTVFLSAASDDAAGVYRSVGFRRVGTACILVAGGD
jgi:ribosomal protein S18 acetylase RimI-like enzyme